MAGSDHIFGFLAVFLEVPGLLMPEVRLMSKL